MVFNPFRTDFEMSLLQGNMTDIGLNFISIIHGVLGADIKGPNGDLYETANEYFIDGIDVLICDRLNANNERTFVDDDYNNCFDLIFAFNKKHYKNQNDFLKAISYFMIQIITNTKTAKMVWNMIKLYATPIQLAPKLLSHISSLLDDKILWLESHEAIFLTDFDASIKLLDYYYQEDKEAFEKKAFLFAEEYKERTTDYLIDKVKKGTDLHVSLLKRKIFRGGDYNCFKELKRYVNKQELNQFIASIQYASIKV
jgi:hypothetical protein